MTPSFSAKDLQSIFDQLKISHTKNTINETYGEILFSGVEKVIKNISLTADDVFVDLGSGLGKLVLQVFMQTPVKEVIGIEINSLLHQAGHTAIENFKCVNAVSFISRSLKLICGDFLNVTFANATVILIASPCYSVKLLSVLEKKFETASHLHTIISLKPLTHLKKYEFKQVFAVECSWDSALCYIYRKSI